MIEVTDQVIDAMARAMWDVDIDHHGFAAEVTDRSWERAKPLYRRRAEAAAEALQRAEADAA